MSKQEIDKLDICPDDEILRDYSAGNVTDDQNLSIIECHLELCDSCKSAVSKYRNSELRERNIEIIVQRLKKRQAEINQHEQDGPVPGSIWRAVPDSDERLFGPLLFVIAESPEVVLVAEVSEKMAQAIDTDVVVETAESGLPFSFMVRADNTFLVRRESLKAFAGVLSSELTQRVVDLCCLGGQMGATASPREYVFFKDPDGAGLIRRQGAKSSRQMFDTGDPRLNFLEGGRRRCVYLHAELAPSSVILRGPLNKPISVIADLGQRVSGIGKLRQFLHQLYNSETFWGVVNKILPITVVFSVVILALQITQTETHVPADRIAFSLGGLAGRMAASAVKQSTTGVAPTFNTILWSATIIFHFFFAAMLFILARRINRRLAWLAFCPVANIFLVVRIAGKPLWWALFLLLPLLLPQSLFVQPLPEGTIGLATFAGKMAGAAAAGALVSLSLPFDWFMIIPSFSMMKVTPPSILVFEMFLLLTFVVVWCSITVGITAPRKKSMVWAILLAIPITAPISLSYLACSET